MTPKPLSYPQVAQALNAYFADRQASLEGFKQKRIEFGDIALDVHNRLKNPYSVVMKLNPYGLAVFVQVVKDYHGR